MKLQAVSLWKVVFNHSCPACGGASMYRGVLAIRETCPACGFVLKMHDAGDGPAFIVMFVVGALVAVLAVVLEVMLAPPLWWHMVIWPPVVLFLSIFCLRMVKCFFIGVQYQQNILRFRR